MDTAPTLLRPFFKEQGRRSQTKQNQQDLGASYSTAPGPRGDPTVSRKGGRSERAAVLGSVVELSDDETLETEKGARRSWGKFHSVQERGDEKKSSGPTVEPLGHQTKRGNRRVLRQTTSFFATEEYQLTKENW